MEQPRGENRYFVSLSDSPQSEFGLDKKKTKTKTDNPRIQQNQAEGQKNVKKEHKMTIGSQVLPEQPHLLLGKGDTLVFSV